MAVHSSVVPLAYPKPLDRAAHAATFFLGSARHLFARARPSARRSLRHAPCTPWPVLTSLRGRLHRRRRRMFAPLSIGQHQPARASRGQRTGPHTHAMHWPDAQARDRAVAPRSKPRTQGGPLKKRPQGPGAAAVARALARLRSFVTLPVLPVPAGPGRNTLPHIAARRSPRTKHATPAC